MLSDELAIHLAGRYIEFPVHLLSYEEFLRFNQLQDSPESLRSYLMFGGMPYIHNLAMDINVIFEYLRYVITMDEMQSGGNYQGIKQISLRDFLLAEDKEKL